MDIRSNEPYWIIKNALLNSYPSLKKDVSCDVLVIGGGITGALLSYALINSSKDVVLVDRRDICNGSTAASTAMLQYEIDTPLHKLIELRGHTCAVDSYKSCENAIDEIGQIAKKINSDCNYKKKSSIYFTSNKKDLKFLRKEFEARLENNFDVTWLEENDLNELGVNGLAAIKSKSGATIDPYKFATDLLSHNSSKGLRIYDKTEISKTKYHNDSIECMTIAGFKINSKHIIHATGYESTKSLSENVVELKSTYALASEVIENLPDYFSQNIFWNTDSPYLYFRSTEDKRIIMGGGDLSYKNAKLRDKLLGKKKAELTKKFNLTFKNLELHNDYEWAGTFGETKDGLPYMGKPEENVNEYYILGFGGNGITFSVMGMPAILAAIDKKPHRFLEYYRFNR